MTSTQLKWVIEQLAWMARRYADGRSTYAPAMCNEALDVAKALGVEIESDTTLPDPDYATDGMFGRWNADEGRFVRVNDE